MITTRRVAAVIAVISGTAVIVLGVAVAVSHRNAVRDVAAGFVVLLVGVTAWLWLRRDSRQRGERS